MLLFASPGVRIAENPMAASLAQVESSR